MLFCKTKLLYIPLILSSVTIIWSSEADMYQSQPRENGRYGAISSSPDPSISHKRNGKSDRKESLTDASRSHVAGLILARCGSKGIPMKNLAQVGNISLLRRSISTMHAFGKFSSVWVSTDCNEIAKEADLSNAFIHRRSAETATDEAPSILAVKEFLDAHPEVTGVGLVQCTSPFLATPFLHDAFERFEREDFDSVFSVRRVHHLRWITSHEGRVKAANFDPKRRPRRQDWKGELVENGMFYFAKSWLIDLGLLQGGRTGVIEVPANHSHEIDQPVDLDFVRVRMVPDTVI